MGASQAEGRWEWGAKAAPRLTETREQEERLSSAVAAPRMKETRAQEEE